MHNWASHGADAWRMLSLSWKYPKIQEETYAAEGKGKRTILLPDTTFGQLKDEHLARKRARREDMTMH